MAAAFCGKGKTEGLAGLNRDGGTRGDPETLETDLEMNLLEIAGNRSNQL
jgi:hypothetical protein